MSDPRLKVKAEVTHEPHGDVSDERLESLMGKEYVDNVRVSVGHRTSTVHVTFKSGNYFNDKVETVANSAAYWLENDGYADNVEVNRVWVTATDTDE